MKIKSFKPKPQKSIPSQDQQVVVQPERQAEDFIKPPVFSRFDNQANQPRKETLSGDKVRVIPLGGVGDVTKNMYVYEYKDDIIIIDCGVSFPDEGMPGIDLVIPDISYLRDKKHKIKGIIITHGHDDHYGALPYLWPELDVPIYSQRLTCGLIKSKFTEHNLPKDKIHELKIDDTIKLGAFDISFYQVSHSVPDSTGIVLKTPIGTLIHQSDFKIDWTPVNGQVPDVGTVAQLGKEGVIFMTIDCLRVEKQGYTLSEKTIEPTFERIEQETKGKMILTLITSNITRIQQAINVAARAGRKVILSGRSMENNFQVARDLGYLDIPPNTVIAQEEIKRFPDDKLMLIVAGSLGQPGSALSRVANNDHRFIRLNKNDTVVFSADPMPSAEEAQGVLIDQLTRFGCKVYYSTLTSDLHVSGHAAAEELKLMINLAKPNILMPIGGNFRHIRAFYDMAQDLGFNDEHLVISHEVAAIEIYKDRFSFAEPVPVANVYVDGLGVGDIGSIVLRDRQVMSEEGIVMVLVPLEQQTGKFAGEPDIISRGFVFEKESEDMLDAAREIVKSVLSDPKKSQEGEDTHFDWRYIRQKIERALEKFFYQEIKRKPLIVSYVVEV